MQQIGRILFLIAFLSSSICFSQDSTKIQGGIYYKELIYETFLFGKVKNIKTIDGKDTTEQFYNKNGQLVFEISPLFKNLHQFIYNTNGNIIQDISYDGSEPDDEIIGVDSYVFTQDNKLLLEVNDAVRWGFSDKTTFEYDKNGNLSRKESYSKGQIREVSEFNYNNINKLKEERIFDDSMKFIQKILTKYNDKGKIVDVSSFDSRNDLTERFTYDYNERQFEVKETRYHAFQSYTFEYDNFGHLMKIIQDTPGYVRNYKLKLDSKNNWVEKLEYVDGKPGEPTTRTITYY